MLLCMGLFWIFSSGGPSMVQKPCWVGAIAVKQLVGRNSAAYCAGVQRWVDDASPIYPN